MTADCTNAREPSRGRPVAHCALCHIKQAGYFAATEKTGIMLEAGWFARTRSGVQHDDRGRLLSCNQRREAGCQVAGEQCDRQQPGQRPYRPLVLLSDESDASVQHQDRSDLVAAGIDKRATVGPTKKVGGIRLGLVWRSGQHVGDIVRAPGGHHGFEEPVIGESEGASGSIGDRRPAFRPALHANHGGRCVTRQSPQGQQVQERGVEAPSDAEVDPPRRNIASSCPMADCRARRSDSEWERPVRAG